LVLEAGERGKTSTSFEVKRGGGTGPRYKGEGPFGIKDKKKSPPPFQRRRGAREGGVLLGGRMLFPSLPHVERRVKSSRARERGGKREMRNVKKTSIVDLRPRVETAPPKK